MRFGLQRAKPCHLLNADQVEAEQNVSDASGRHHLGLTEFLAGDAASTGVDLHFCQHRALMGLDVRPVGNAGGIAGRLNTRDVALDLVHVDYGAGRADIRGLFWPQAAWSWRGPVWCAHPVLLKGCYA